MAVKRVCVCVCVLTPVHSENDSRVYFIIVLTTDYTVGAP